MIDENVIVVGISDIKIAQEPKMLKTNLGSCVAVCLYSKQKKVGGMLHLMLASSSGVSDKAKLKKEKYADTGIPEMINQLSKSYGASKSELEAKIFGGAKVLQNVTRNIGEENAAAVRNILRAEGIRIMASRLGGVKGYKVSIELSTGKVYCQIFGEEEKEY